MGNGISSGSRPSGGNEVSLAQIPENEKFFGLENFGNTCYCNAVLQVLYFCAPLRAHLLSHVQQKGLAKRKLDVKDKTLLDCMAELFHKISMQKKAMGYVTPKTFVARLQLDNEMFRGSMHQDAHEFLNFVLNAMCDQVEAELKAATGLTSSVVSAPPSPTSPSSASPSPYKTWVHEIFEGVLTNETKCLGCSTITNRDEAFLDLSVEIEPNTSLTACLKKFGAVETLAGNDRFFCDTCHALQDAEKRMHMKRIPHVLALHLKRFKYMEESQSFAKLFHRILFPSELKLPRVLTDAASLDSTKVYQVRWLHGGLESAEATGLRLLGAVWRSYSHWQRHGPRPLREHGAMPRCVGRL
ncbi:hypothetical protein, variant 1 [Aphanomyces invadans]|uniref:ubiquitinyl hydrolase 1 n=1 Tax=Aphanomyces invadans TaxID=157072 RepID=A0A024TWZ4_9STRA|nr:hypothetical protein, variant 1 [Aphanomyces invadans]ETV98161.1 hypothetical protein, variant 1 [Aphanomyces invadans]|eukprot:XP_008873036.1 hypothetical protein, variant 1 [Aphanomyces invadans]